MAYKQKSPIPVVEGGTGAQTLTDHGVLLGSGTSAVTALAVASTGETLMGATGADPSFTGSPSFSGSVTAGTGLTVTTGNADVIAGNVSVGTASPANPARISVEESVAGTTGTSVQNTLVNANAGAVAQFIVEANAGDPTCNYAINGGQNWSVGIDNSDTDAFKITTGSSPSGGTTVLSVSTALAMSMPATSVTMNGGQINIGTGVADHAINIGTSANAGRTTTVGNTTAASVLALKYGTGDFTLASATGTVMSALDTGEITYPLQPAFFATISAILSNVTGDGTNYTIVFDTEIFDQNGDFDGTSTFTAPVTGRYAFSSGVLFSGLAAGSTGVSNSFVTSNRALSNINLLVGTIQNTGQFQVIGSVFTDMDAGDTCILKAAAGGTAKVVNITTGGAIDNRTRFSGYLVC